MKPFLTLYTPTFRRPQGLARCLWSVASQTIAGDIEQIVIPDHVGRGIGGMYAQVPQYVDAVHGDYVAFLCDDDVLTNPTVVEQVQAMARVCHQPPLILVQTNKNGSVWPSARIWPPQMGAIDLNCAIVRRDIWKAHAAAGAYLPCYEGDFWFLDALASSGVAPIWFDLVFSVGAVSRGAAECAA